jgi:hypothetical protein
MPSISGFAWPAVKRTRRGFDAVAYTALYFSRFLLTMVPAQLLLVLLFLRRPSAPARVWVYCAVCIVYVAVVMAITPSAVPLRNAAFFLSFLPPLLLMFSRGSEPARWFTSDRFVIAMCLLTLAETVLVNTSYGADVWFFRASHPHRNLIFGETPWYQRPSGYASVTSSTAFVLLMSMLLKDGDRGDWKLLSWRHSLVALTLVPLFSGTGFVMFGIYLAIWMIPVGIRMRRAHLFSIPFVAIALGALLYGANGGVWSDQLNKFSFHYVGLIVDNKMNMLRDVRERSLLVWLFGRQVNSPPQMSTMNDFGYFALWDSMGSLGVILVMSAPALFIASWRKMKAATLFYFLSFVHYPALCSPPGAVLLALYIHRLYELRRPRTHAMPLKAAA